MFGANAEDRQGLSVSERVQSSWGHRQSRERESVTLKIRDLKQRIGDVIVPSWPPVWTASYRAGDRVAVGEAGELQSATAGDDHVKVTMIFDGRVHYGRLKWDGPPAVEVVAKILAANIGQKLRTIGVIEISSELDAR